MFLFPILFLLSRFSFSPLYTYGYIIIRAVEME